MKRAIVITGFVISLLLVLSLVFALDNNSTAPRGTNYSKCILSCVNTSQVNHAICVENHKNSSEECREEFKECILDIKNITNLTKKQVISSLKNCNKNYILCRKEAQAAKNLCIKNCCF